MKQEQGWWRQAAQTAKRGFGEFLTWPLCVIGGFMLLAVGCYFLDNAFWSANKEPAQGLHWLGVVFGSIGALSTLLGTIVTGLFTITSITFSLLLLTVQQAGASYSNQVFGQFLRRIGNQLYFGFFVGLSIFALFNLVVANGSHRPVFAAAVTVVLAAFSLFLIVLLTYTTINQMRPHTIVNAIRGHVLTARTRQMSLLRKTRRQCSLGEQHIVRRLRSERCGYVMSVDVGKIAGAVAQAGTGGIEVRLSVRIGDYIAYHDPLAELRCETPLTDAGADALAGAVRGGVNLQNHRDLNNDPAYGLEQLATIGWTIISTARSNPYPGILVCRMLRDIVARWAEQGDLPEDVSCPVVYEDRVRDLPLRGLETLIVAASESMQPQTLAAIMRTFAKMLPNLQPELAAQADDIVLRSLSSLGEHVLTQELEDSLGFLGEALKEAGHHATAEELVKAQDNLGASVGALNSRSTRAKAA